MRNWNESRKSKGIRLVREWRREDGLGCEVLRLGRLAVGRSGL